VLSAAAMGGSIWSMHFVAMVSFSLDMPISYDALPTLGSLAAAIAMTGLGIFIVARAPRVGGRPLIAAGLCMGLGVATMHYMGMAGMRLAAATTYDPVFFALSVVIAVVASTLALWLAFTLDRQWHKVAAALVMAAAIAGMHFTGMAAANFTPAPDAIAPVHTSVPLLAMVVAVATVSMLALGLLTSAIDRRFAARAEQEAEALRGSERYLRDVLDTARDAYVATDAEGRIIEWNAEAAATFGWAREEVLGRAFADLMAEDHRADHVAGLRRYLDTGNAAILTARAELTALRRDGTAFPIEMTTAPARHRDRTTFHAFLHDISIRRVSQQLLIAARDEAESSSRAKSQFLAHMSHELRTPLNAIIGFSEIIRDRLLGTASDEVYRGYAGDIHRSGQHLLEVITEILDLSKAEAGFLELREQVFDTGAMVERCAEIMRELARDAGLAFTVSIASDLPRLRADERRVRQVLLNLLSNAVKFTPSGGSVSLTAAATEGREVQITVADTGIGMTIEELKIAVMPFAQVDNGLTRKYEGTGLGLPLAKTLVEVHGASLHISSEPDAGTTAVVTFPARRSGPPEESQTSEARFS
jgi:PAS domain S-box-containing protein